MARMIHGHLDEAQIIEAIVDEAGLDPTVRHHLMECPDCHAERKVLESKLAQFAKISAEQASIPMRRLRFADLKAKRSNPSWWKVRPSFGMGLAFASLLAVLLTPQFFDRQGREFSVEKVYQEMLLDEKFMAEVERLEDNPLPRFFVDISDLSDQEMSDELQDSKVQIGPDDNIVA
ncbi:MAG: hypothetical protein AAGU11_08335 [Syntrophobacteraceae bacterium]